MQIQSANVAPDFSLRRQIHAQDLRKLEEPAVIFEHHGIDSDGASFYVYTVAGWLDGQNIFSDQGGATIGGDVIVIHADTRQDADDMAGLGLQDTINALENEDAAMLDALAAQARLDSVSALERLDLAIRKDKSDAYVEDIDKIRPLIGDDIILAAGH